MPTPRKGTTRPHGDHVDVRVTLPDGTKSPWFHLDAGLSPARVEEARAAIAEQAARGELTPGDGLPAGAPRTLAEIEPRWIELVKASDLAPATKAQHAINARALVARFGPSRPEALTGPALRSWLREERAKRSASRVRNIFNTLGKMLDDAAAEGWHSAPNPCRLPKVREELPAMGASHDDDKARHTEAEATSLCFDKRIPVERRIRYVLAFTTGMRDGELAGLRWSSVGRQDGVDVLIVTSSIDPTGERGAPKTEARKDTVPIHPLTLQALPWWHAEGWEAYVGRAPKPHDPLLPDADGKHGVMGAWRRHSARI